MTNTACMGGWCEKRDRCGHFHAASPDQQPKERLCPRGRDGAAQMESADMTRVRFSIAARVEQVRAVLRPHGITQAEIGAALAVNATSRMVKILHAAVAAGAAFSTRARVSSVIKVPEMVFFPTAADRDAFRAVYDVEMAARKKARDVERAQKKYLRNRSAEVAKRSAARAEAREQREANAIAAAIARRDKLCLALAEAEQRQQRARLNQEAREAKKDRAKVEVNKTVRRLKVETKAVAETPMKKGTTVAAGPNSRGPAHLDGELDLSQAKITRAPTPPGRYDVDNAPRVVSSGGCRKWAEAVAA
ncbi:MAG: hypothetical protein ACT6S0_04770 [Roseateles sp.]|uniref:hypothetical protein n=1 Tax=Roseateles sp. TaxID=1971397 RepID=UPI004036DD9B